MTQVEAELSALIKAAAEHPGRLVVGYGPDDREHAVKAAAKLRQRAAELDALSGEQGTE